MKTFFILLLVITCFNSVLLGQEINPLRTLTAERVSMKVYDDFGNVVSTSKTTECEIPILTDYEGLIWVLSNPLSSYIPCAEAELKQGENNGGKYISISVKTKEMSWSPNSEKYTPEGDATVTHTFYAESKVFVVGIFKDEEIAGKIRKIEVIYVGNFTLPQYKELMRTYET